MVWLTSQILVGDLVTLEPLSMSHCAALQDAIKEGEGWKVWYTNLPSPESMPIYIESALAMVDKGALAFAVRHNVTGKIIGSTRIYDVKPEHRRVMIGYSWYEMSWRRTGVNTECKYLMLKLLFEKYKAIAVEFHTHFFNHISRNAILRLGAKQDGVLRNHQIMRDGTYRDTLVFSIIESEWSTVKRNLHHKLGKLEATRCFYSQAPVAKEVSLERQKHLASQK